jgi:hypothetical protein
MPTIFEPNKCGFIKINFHKLMSNGIFGSDSNAC